MHCYIHQHIFCIYKDPPFHWLSLSVILLLLIGQFFQQDALEQNEQRKKQEQAMREKLLAEEAKQHDPKVQSM